MATSPTKEVQRQMIHIFTVKFPWGVTVGFSVKNTTGTTPPLRSTNLCESWPRFLVGQPKRPPWHPKGVTQEFLRREVAEASDTKEVSRHFREGMASDNALRQPQGGSTAARPRCHKSSRPRNLPATLLAESAPFPRACKHLHQLAP